jgi:hypothetical protein
MPLTWRDLPAGEMVSETQEHTAEQKPARKSPLVTLKHKAKSTKIDQYRSIAKD